MLTIKYGDGHVTRQCITDDEREVMQQVWEGNTQPDPFYTVMEQGQRWKQVPLADRRYVPVRWLSMTIDKLYKQNRTACVAKGMPVRCKATFIQERPYNIRKRRFTAGLCKICVEHYRRKAADPSYTGTAAYCLHKKLKDNQVCATGNMGLINGCCDWRR